MPYARKLKRFIREAERSHALRIKNLLALEQHAAQQNESLTDMGWSGPSPTAPESASLHVCGVCNSGFATPAALAVHEAHRHNLRIAVRRFAPDSVCRIYWKCYHTRRRLLQHLDSGSTLCWQQLMRRFEPLDMDEVQCLDDQDRFARVAHHQRGVKF